MKKDMGGAATALALAHMIMARGLKLRLRVLVPAVENSIAAQVPPARHLYVAQGHHRRDRQHRRRRPAHPRRCARARRRGQAGADRRLRHADRRRARRARPGHPGVLHRRRRARRRVDGLRRQPRTIRCGGCRCGGLTRRCWNPRSPIINNVGGSQGGAITAALFMRRFVVGEILGAFRRVRLDAFGQSRPARRRRMPSRARALRAACRALRLS